TPPARAVGRVCTRRASGTSVAPQRNARRRTSGVTASVIRNAAVGGAKFTRPPRRAARDAAGHRPPPSVRPPASPSPWCGRRWARLHRRRRDEGEDDPGVTEVGELDHESVGRERAEEAVELLDPERAEARRGRLADAAEHEEEGTEDRAPAGEADEAALGEH